MIKIIPKKTKHALSFRLKIGRKKLLRHFKNEINPLCLAETRRGQASIWNSSFYNFYWSKYTRAWLPCVNTVTCNEKKGFEKLFFEEDREGGVKKVENTVNNLDLHVSAQTSLVPSASFFDLSSTDSASAWPLLAASESLCSQFRRNKSLCSQFRINKSLCSQFRRNKSLCSQFRINKSLCSQFRRNKRQEFPRNIWDYKQSFQNFICASKTLNYGTQSHALFGRYGIIFNNYGILTAKFLETTYMVVKKMVKKKRFWLRLCCQTPVTSRPAETRMGKGKGAINHWATLVRPGQIWFEFEALNTAQLNQILICLQNRSPYPIKLIGITKR
jgi:large subunit ribosomal protein L16